MRRANTYKIFEQIHSKRSPSKETHRYGGFLLGGGLPVGRHMSGLGYEPRWHTHCEAVQDPPLTRGRSQLQHSVHHLIHFRHWEQTTLCTRLQTVYAGVRGLITCIASWGADTRGYGLGEAFGRQFDCDDGVAWLSVRETAEYQTPGKVVRHWRSTPLSNDADATAQVGAPPLHDLLPAACRVVRDARYAARALPKYCILGPFTIHHRRGRAADDGG